MSSISAYLEIIRLEFHENYVPIQTGVQIRLSQIVPFLYR